MGVCLKGPNAYGLAKVLDLYDTGSFETGLFAVNVCELRLFHDELCALHFVRTRWRPSKIRSMSTIVVIVVGVEIAYRVHFARCHVQLGALFCSNLLCVVFARLKGDAENEVAPGLGACAYFPDGIVCGECLVQERRILPRHKAFAAGGLVAVDGRLAWGLDNNEYVERKFVVGFQVQGNARFFVALLQQHFRHQLRQRPVGCVVSGQSCVHLAALPDNVDLGLQQKMIAMRPVSVARDVNDKHAPLGGAFPWRMRLLRTHATTNSTSSDRECIQVHETLLCVFLARKQVCHDATVAHTHPSRAKYVSTCNTHQCPSLLSVLFDFPVEFV